MPAAEVTTVRKTPSDRDAVVRRHVLHRGQMTFDDFAKVDVNEVAVLVDHRVQRVDLAEHPHDLELLFVQRIAREVALDRRADLP